MVSVNHTADVVVIVAAVIFVVVSRVYVVCCILQIQNQITTSLAYVSNTGSGVIFFLSYLNLQHFPQGRS